MRINDQIRIPQVRLFDDTTDEEFGIVALDKAKQLAVERELDLVEVAPLAQPPVCRLMDYGRYKFEALKKEKESRRGHNVIHVKEMKLRPKISEHDFQTKFGYIKSFLADGDKVKLTIMFRGREMVHMEYGRRLLDRIAEELKDVAAIERSPLVEGRNMIMIMSPGATTKKPTARDGQAAAAPRPQAAVPKPADTTAEAPKEESANGAAKEPVAVGAPAAEPAAAAEATAKPAPAAKATTKPKATTTRRPAAKAAPAEGKTDAKDKNP